MKHIRPLFLLFCLLTALSTFAQIHEQTHEFGVFTGFTNYFGSLNDVASFKQVRPAVGGFYRYNIKYRGAWRTSMTWGQAQFNDADVNNSWNQQRNLSFKSNIIDVSTMIEFNFFKYDKDSKKHWFTPYLATGLSIFFFNPETQYNGKWYYLQPLGTEGEIDPSYSGTKPYHLYSFAIPMVGGFKFSVFRFWNVGIEAGLRQTFTKYLDDASGKYPSYVDLPGGSTGLAAALSNRSAGGADGAQIGLQRGQGGFDKILYCGITISYTIMKTRCPTTAGGSTYR